MSGSLRIDKCLEESAEVTPQGILFRGWYYSCSQAVKEKWFVRAAEMGNWSLPAFVETPTDGILMILPFKQEVFITSRILNPNVAATECEGYYKKIQVLKEELKAARNCKKYSKI